MFLSHTSTDTGIGRHVKLGCLESGHMCVVSAANVWPIVPCKCHSHCRFVWSLLYLATWPGIHLSVSLLVPSYISGFGWRRQVLIFLFSQPQPNSCSFGSNVIILFKTAALLSRFTSRPVCMAVALCTFHYQLAYSNLKQVYHKNTTKQYKCP